MIICEHLFIFRHQYAGEEYPNDNQNSYFDMIENIVSLCEILKKKKNNMNFTLSIIQIQNQPV